MAETNSLLNCRTGNCTGGSNPPSSAKGTKSVPFLRKERGSSPPVGGSYLASLERLLLRNFRIPPLPQKAPNRCLFCVKSGILHPRSCAEVSRHLSVDLWCNVEPLHPRCPRDASEITPRCPLHHVQKVLIFRHMRVREIHPFGRNTMGGVHPYWVFNHSLLDTYRKYKVCADGIIGY